jgi:hypothetical protein
MNFSLKAGRSLNTILITQDVLGTFTRFLEIEEICGYSALRLRER